jgi:arylsulfatase A-like enzyme
VEDSRFKYLAPTDTWEGQLFSVEDDPGEKTDLAAEIPDVADDYRKRLQEWLEAARTGGILADPSAAVGPEDEDTVTSSESDS